MSLAVYIDETGNDGKSQHFILAGLGADLGNWTTFINDWWDALKVPKPLLPGKYGRIYYKTSEADSQSRCFRKFSSEQVRQKTKQLMDIIAKHVSLAVLCSVPNAAFNSIVTQGVSANPKRKKHIAFRQPYFFLFSEMMREIVRQQRRLQPVDFVFDENGSLGYRWLRIISAVKQRLGPLPSQLIGRVVPDDDTITLQLQAADLVAARARKLLAGGSDYFSEGLRAVLVHKQFRERELTEFMRKMSEEHSSRIRVRHP